MSSKIFCDSQTVTSPVSIGKVAQNEHFFVKTLNGYGAIAQNTDEFDTFFTLPNRDKMHHACTGPIEIKGITDKHSVGIRIHHIEVKNALTSLSVSTGLKRTDYTKRYAKYYTVKNDTIQIDRDIFMAAEKSVGLVTTVNEIPLKGSRVCPRGGNMDIPALTEGAMVYLPVDYKKALVSLGDVHFRQGCGEISGIALESDALLEVSAFACEKYPFPIIENDTDFYILGYGATSEEASLCATNNALSYLKRQSAFSRYADGELYSFLGGYAHLICGNTSGKTLSYAVCLPKNSFVDKYGLSLLKAPQPVTPKHNYKQIFEDNIARYESLPIVHSGYSREIRLIPDTPYALSRFNPNVYSFVAQGVVEVPDTDKERIVINQYFADYLKKHGIQMNTLYSCDRYSLIRYEDAPQTIEVVVKAAFKGSCKHTYKNLPTVPTRFGKPLTVGQLHKPYVRFDWRSDDENDDAVLPEGLADYYINTRTAKQTVLKTYRLIKKKLNQHSLDIEDICFFLNTAGDTIICEITPDNMGPIRYTGKDTKLQAIFTNKDKYALLEKYRAFRQLLHIHPKNK